MRVIWHIENKAVSEHEYFGSLTALFKKVGEVGVSKSKIEKASRNLETYEIETETHIIRKARMLSVSDIHVFIFLFFYCG
jgi:hypothetical protein